MVRVVDKANDECAGTLIHPTEGFAARESCADISERKNRMFACACVCLCVLTLESCVVFFYIS